MAYSFQQHQKTKEAALVNKGYGNGMLRISGSRRAAENGRYTKDGNM